MFKPKYLIGLLLGLASCGGGGKEPPTAGDKPAAARAAMTNAQPAARTPAGAEQSAIPKGAQYTIFCASITSQLHVESANQMRRDLIAATGMPDWYVVHQNDRSTLYYGYYRAIADTNDAKETARAQADRQKIDRMTDKMNNRPFARALFVELNAPDPVAKPEWNLLNANGAYTLQIGVYKGSIQRKDAAVEAVKAARAQGIEAYYLHGEAASMVCVGAWPKNAMRITDAASAGGNDPSKTLMVVPKTGDRELDAAFDSSAKQANAQLVRQQVEILDPTMMAAIKQFQYNSVNGEYIMHQGPDGRQTYDPSQILEIPDKSKDGTAEHTQQRPLAPRQAGQFDPSYRPPIPRQNDPPPAPSGVGRLKSIPGG